MTEKRNEPNPLPGPPTVRTISEIARVSASTVSRALKGDPRISEKTRASIAAIAHEQGYTPNAIARGLVTRSSGVVGIALGNVQNPFYAELVEGLHRRLVALGKYPMLINIGSETLDRDAILPIRQYQMDGCIFAAARLSSNAAKACEANRLPIVMINRIARVHSCAVSCDNYAGGLKAGNLLIENGHRRIAFVAGRADTSTSEDRESGLLRALRDVGMQLVGSARGDYTYDGGYRATRELLTGRDRPDGLFCANDIMAIGAIDAIRGAGLRVPHDISVVGFDDIQQARWQNYRLTTIAQPMEAMIKRSLELLLERIGDPAQRGESISIHGELKLRDTVRRKNGN